MASLKVLVLIHSHHLPIFQCLFRVPSLSMLVLSDLILSPLFFLSCIFQKLFLVVYCDSHLAMLILGHLYFSTPPAGGLLRHDPETEGTTPG